MYENDDDDNKEVKKKIVMNEIEIAHSNTISTAV